MINLRCIVSLLRGSVFSIDIISEHNGSITFKATGNDELFENESGCHRIQQVSPTDKKKRVQTSTIRIAVLPEITEQQLVIKENDLDYKFIRGSGSGGQARNKLSNCVQLTHIPSGLMVRCESGRSQWQNKQSALETLRNKLWEEQNKKLTDRRSTDRMNQVGSGERNEKRRTVAYQRGEVIDHITGRRWELKKYLKGEW